MSTKRLWLIAGSAAAIVVVFALLATFLSPPASEAGANPTPTPTSSRTAVPTPSAPATPTPTPSPTASPTPTPAPTATPTAASCATTTTDAFRASMASQGRVSSETQDQPAGAQPFAGFPNGSPRGALVCRWVASPGSSADDVIDLAWAPIDPENAVAAMQMLEAAAYERIDAPEGVYLAARGSAGSKVDAEGFANAYLFTPRDVRWAAFKGDLAAIKAPQQTR